MSTPKRLEGFDTFEHEDDGISHTVYTRGAGPGVLLMHELPGMVRQCVDLATVIANPFANMTASDQIRPRQLAQDAPLLLIACGLALRSFE
jgi:Tfp pilus assembly PilM family ATPase